LSGDLSVPGPGAMAWRRIGRLPALVAQDASAIVGDLRRSWRVLWALTVIESRRKYAGSILGMLWYPTYSALLLGSYCFLYLAVFKFRFRELSTYEFVLFVFSGLIPYLGFSEAVNTSTSSVRQNLSLLKNAVFPLEFVPVKSVCAALFGLASSLAILIAMVAPTPYRGWHLLYLPVAIVSLWLFCVAVAWTLSAVAVLLPDILQVINIVLLLLMFLSPVAYAIDTVPESVRLLVYLNPLTYLIESFRYALLGMRVVPFWADLVFLIASAAGTVLAGSFFRRVSPIFSDYE
jgi:lipopolysaccharide transport system permease protein